MEKFATLIRILGIGNRESGNRGIGNRGIGERRRRRCRRRRRHPRVGSHGPLGFKFWHTFGIMGRFQISKWHTLIHSRLGCRELLGLGGIWWDLAGLGFGGALLIQMANLGQARPRFQIPNFKLKLTAGFGFGIWIWIRFAMDLDQSWRRSVPYPSNSAWPGRYAIPREFQISNLRFQISKWYIATSNRDFELRAEHPQSQNHPGKCAI